MSTFKYFTLVNGHYLLWSPPLPSWDLRIEYDETGRPIDAQFAVGACTVPKDDGWQDWLGGEEPPVPRRVKVDVKNRRGDISVGRPAGEFAWGVRLVPGLTIVKWRLAKTASIDDGWKEWRGGLSAPVEPRVLVDVELRSGAVSTNTVAHALFWYHEQGPLDIVKWRLAKNA